MTGTLNREKSFSVKGNTYVVKFPTVGEFMEIESRRMLLSNGTYSYLLKSSLVSSSIAMDMIDMAATLSTLAPKIVKDLKSQTLLDMDIIDGNELLAVYKKEVAPWVDEWMGIIRNFGKENADDTNA